MRRSNLSPESKSANGAAILVSGLIIVLLVYDFGVGQGSDYMAYPNNYTPMKEYVISNRQLTFNRLPGRSEDYTLGPGDILSIQVVGLPNLDMEVEVSNSGTVNVPYADIFQAEGKTLIDLEAEIADDLETRQLIRDPQVVITVIDYRAKEIFVVGEVDRPGQYVMSQQLTVMDAIFLAGGLDFTAARRGYLHRRGDRKGPTTPPVVQFGEMILPGGGDVIELDLQPLKRGGSLETNYVLERGDVVFVPARDVAFFYVVGDVLRAGAYEIPPSEKMLVSRAISWAGGPRKTAKMSDGLLVRYAADGSRRELAVDFAAVLAGRQPDFEIEANDVIFIPGSNAKTVGYGLLAIVPRVVQSALLYAP